MNSIASPLFLDLRANRRCFVCFHSYSLTTRLPNPHPSNISSLSFSPVHVTVLPADKSQSLMLLSTGEDGSARVWREKRVLFKSGKVQG